MLSAVKLCQSSSMSGPSAQVKPISPKMAPTSSITWPIGCRLPWPSGRVGRLTSTRSEASRASSAEVSSAVRRASSTLSISAMSSFSRAPKALRSSGDIPPSVFISLVTWPFLPSTPTRTASRAARSAAACTAPSASLRILERSVILRSKTKKGSLWCQAPSSGSLGRTASAVQQSLLEGCLGLIDQGLNRCRLAHGQIGHHLAVDFDAGLEDAVHELRIGQAMLARGGIDALDPKRAERALLVAPVAIGILQPLLDLFDADAERILGAAAIALGELENLLVAGMGRYAPFYACHGLPRVGEEVALDDARIRLGDDVHSGLLAQEAVAPLAHAVPLAGHAMFDLARGGEAKTLLSPGLGLHFGHFCSFSKGYAPGALPPRRAGSSLRSGRGNALLEPGRSKERGLYRRESAHASAGSCGTVLLIK